LKQGLIWNFERIRKRSKGIRGIWEMKFGILVTGTYQVGAGMGWGIFYMEAKIRRTYCRLA
jgi:hypothetical protein